MRNRVVCAALAAALILSTASCGKEDEWDVGLAQYIEDETENSFLSDDKSGSSDETDDSGQEEAEADDLPVSFDDAQVDLVLNDGTYFIADGKDYSQEEAEELERDAVGFVDKFCQAAFNYASADIDFPERIEPMLASVTKASDFPKNLYTVLSGTGAELSYYWYDPALIYVDYDPERGEMVDIQGTARIHAVSSKVASSDYEAYLELEFYHEDEEWKVFYVDSGLLYLPGEFVVTPSNVERGNIHIESGTAVAKIDWEDPEGYLTDYYYILNEDLTLNEDMLAAREEARADGTDEADETDETGDAGSGFYMDFDSIPSVQGDDYDMDIDE